MKLKSSTLLVLLPLMIITAAYGAKKEEKIVSNYEVEQNQLLTDAERDAISQAATYTIIHVHQAREAIHNNHFKEAQAEVKDALRLISIIENTSPTYTITSSIKSGNETHDNKYTIHPLVVPVYDQFGEFSVLESVKREKRKRAKSKKAGPEVEKMIESSFFWILSQN